MKRAKPLVRRAPLRRKSAPKSRVQSKRPQPLYRLERPCSSPVIGDGVVACPKRSYVRSQTLREAYRLIPCQHCGRDDGTVCCAHSNWSLHGKGGHIKADDSAGASLCAACHVPILDQGSHLSREERKKMWWRAHVASINLLVNLGLWPEGIAVPQTHFYPWAVES